MTDLPKRPATIQQIADNSAFGSGAGPFYTLSLDLLRGNGSTDAKPWAIEDFETIMEFTRDWINNPKEGELQPSRIELWLVREETLAMSEKEYCNPDERTLLWSWEAK